MYGTLNDYRHDLPDTSCTVITDETIGGVSEYPPKNLSF